ncbi:MAG: pyrC [Clostridiales bacterium]|jgi:dihydroorotase|nr:pyrC [Clostridiales bacterium]
MKTLIKNCSIYTVNGIINNKDVFIQDGIITGISSGINIDDGRVIEADNALIIPGLVDMHCSIGEPGYEFNETLVTGSLAAAKGGFTAITYNPNLLPVIDNKTVVEYVINKASEQSQVKVYPYGSMTKGCKGTELAEIMEMRKSGVVAISDGDIAVQDSLLMSRIFKYSKMLDCPLITHCEDRSLSFDNGIADGYVAALLGIRGALNTAEELIVARNILLAENYNIKLHLTHISSKTSVSMIRFAKSKGVKITAETSPQYFVLDETSLLKYNTLSKVNPPLRTAEDVMAIIEGLVDGTIDVISSDHNPKTIDSKAVEFQIASFGISGFETAFALAYTHLVENGRISLDELIMKMSTNPANILNIPRYEISLGQKADFTIIKLKNTKIDASKFYSKAKFSPFDGLTVGCEVVATFVEGKEVEFE